MPEYAVVLGVITLAIVTSFAVLSNSIENLLNQVVGLLP
jgi:Flp pilus assembly pilin Flp